jgi:hypothetical protein
MTIWRAILIVSAMHLFFWLVILVGAALTP